MNAMNGMLEGQMEGNQAKYMMAKQKYDDAIGKIRQEYETSTAVSDMMLKATDGLIDSAKLSQQAAASAIGADDKTIDKMRGDFKDLYKAVLQAHEKANSPQTKLGNIVAGDWMKQKPVIETAQQMAGDYQRRVDSLTSAYDALEAAIKKNPKLESDINAAALKGGSEGIAMLNRLDPVVGRFVQAAQKLTPSAMANLNQGLSAGAIRAAGVKFANMEMEALPTLKGGMSVLRAAMPAIKEDAQSINKFARERYEQWRREGISIQRGTPSEAFGDPGVPEVPQTGSGSSSVTFDQLPPK
jgi:hypothetical protein